ncbi:MAG: transglutaminase-like domain-containing protein [Candidatus Poribacteria bacterium]|nr:transglutaminase-like domain-containing protein [Candidatus Poribacteria bacterium]
MSDKTVRLSYRGFDDFDANTRGLNLQIDDVSGTVHLSKGVNYTDEMGNCNLRDLEVVSRTNWIRKAFWIENPAANAAMLLPYILEQPEPGHRLSITINDRHTVWFEEPKERDYWTDCWTPIPIPVEALKPGLNSFVLAAEGEGLWGFLIEQSCQPNRSAKSQDAGRNWVNHSLGANDAYDGEYLIRLRLDQYASLGIMDSLTVDIGNFAADDGVAAPLQINRIAPNLHADLPTDTNVTLKCRVGSTPEYHVDTWTNWFDAAQPNLNDEVSQSPSNCRYLQWQLILLTDNPLVTPSLETLEVEVDVDAKMDRDPVAFQVSEWNLPKIIHGSHNFSFLPYTASRAEIFRKRWKLDDVIAGATSEFDRFLRLSAWTRHQWENGWNMGEIHFCPPWDGMLILELASRKLSLGMCTHFNTVFVHACSALGLIARTVVIGRHCVAEVWSEEFDKWIMVDTGGDSHDETKATYCYTRNGVPMSTLEIHNAWVNQDFDGLAIEPEHAAKRFADTLTSRTALFDFFCINPRNDELQSLSPGEPEHGKISYHYDGYLWWKDDSTPPNPWFSRQSSRVGDFYWTPNRTMIYLSESAHPEVLDVDLTTTMPNFKHYLVQRNDGDWELQPNRFSWKLILGQNQLRVKAVSQFGWEGKDSHVVLKRSV